MADVTDTFYSGDAFVGYGAQLLIGQGGGSPETFAAVAQVASVTFGEMTGNVINKTHLRSPGNCHEKIVTIRDLGPFTISGQLNLKHGSQNNAGGDGFTSGGLIAIHRTLEERNMKILLPDGSPPTAVPFRGVVSRLSLGEMTLEDLVQFEADIQPLSDYTADLP